MERLNPLLVLRAHWRSLQVRTQTSRSSDRVAKGILAGSLVVVTVVAWLADLHLVNPGSLGATLGLLSAGLLAAFAQLASIRSRYERPDDDYDPDLLTREMLDEAIAHILTAVLLAATLALVIVIAMNVGSDGSSLNRWFSSVVAGIGTYLFLLFVMTVRKLFGAYAISNDLDLTGTDRRG